MDCVTIDVLRRDGESWGVQIAGESPCYIESIEPTGPAAEAGLEVGDFLISINGVSVYNSSHETVIELIKECGKIARFRILPNHNTPTKNKPQKTETPKPKPKPTGSIAQWKNAFIDSDSDSDQDEIDGAHGSDHNDIDYLNLESNKNKKTTHPPQGFDFQVRYDKADIVENRPRPSAYKEIEVEQSNFIVTPETQKQFDEHYHHDGNFVGRRATVAGAFTGDFNVIRNDKEYDDIVGVKSRVLAGIQHFSFTERNEKNRDVYENPMHKDELCKRLGVASADQIPSLPRLYIDGVCAGGFDEIQEMSDCGDLRIRFQDFPKYNIRRHCTSCQGSGTVECESCKGRGFRQKNRFTTLKCMNCHQKGLIVCPDCL